MTVTTSQVRAMVEDQSTFEALDNDSDYEFDDDPEYGRSSFLLIIGFIVVGIFFVGVIWFAYNQGIKTGQKKVPPLITAEAGPVKVTPSQSDAEETPFQDSLVLNEGSSADVEAVMPDTEEPMEPPKEAAATAEAEAEVPSPDAVHSGAEETLSTIAVPSPNPERIAQSPGADSSVREVPAPVESEGEPEAPAETMDVAALEEAAGNAAAEVEETVSKVEPVAPAEVPAPKAAEPAVKTQDSAAVESAAGSSIDPTSGAFVVQILSSPDRGQAESERDKFALRFKDLLTDRGVAVVRADLGAKGVYHRAWVGPFADQAGAGQYCNQLKARGQDCYVTKP